MRAPYQKSRSRRDILRTAMLTSVSFVLVPGLWAPAAAHKLRQESIGRTKAEPPKGFGETPKGPLQIVVSIADQRVTLYSNGARVAQGPVSTGVPGHPTPIGVFSVIQKNRYHRSNLYSNAPMPFMQRITWSGIALHEGPLPGGPASHGCIRLTRDFASRLWVTTELGARVVVARNDVLPVDFVHARLFVPKAKPGDRLVAASEPEVKLVQTSQLDASRGDKPLAITDPPKPGAPAEDGAADQPAKRTGHLAVFVSRKEQKIFVRRGFVPLFDMPVTIDDPEQPLGTHVFTATELTENGARMRWNVMTIPSEQPRAAETGGKKRNIRQTTPKPPEAKAIVTPERALDRIHFPQEAIDRIGELLIPGSSLVVSDQGLGPETGKGTDFIVVLR